MSTPLSSAPPKRKRSKRWLAWTGAFFGVFILGVVVGDSGDGSNAQPTAGPTAAAITQPAVTVTAAPAPARTIAGPRVTVKVKGDLIAVPGPTVTVRPHPTVTVKIRVTEAPPAAKVAFGGDGTFLVGTDVKPGTYRSESPASGNCYWARMSNLSGEGESEGILNNSNSAGPSIVTILSSDMAIETSGCDDFTKID